MFVQWCPNIDIDNISLISYTSGLSSIFWLICILSLWQWVVLCLHVAPLDPLPETWLSLTHAHIYTHARTYVPSCLYYICFFLYFKIKHRYYLSLSLSFFLVLLYRDWYSDNYSIEFVFSMSTIERHRVKW